jgi:hypothetical protein
VVGGSTACRLLGEAVEPADLDVVVADSASNRLALISAMIELQSRLVDGRRLESLRADTPLPWDWSWRILTAYGLVDVIVRFVDGTSYADLDPSAADVALAGGARVRCFATRHAA